MSIDVIERSPVVSNLRWATIAALVMAILPLSIGFVYYIFAVDRAIVFPFGLDYGEGIVWQQMREIVAGRGYGRIDVFPAIVFHYPPLYHLVTAGLASASGLDQLVAGRLVSVVSTIATGGVITAIVARITRPDSGIGASSICGLFAGLAIFSMTPLLHWSRLMRVDMLSFFFSFLGLYFGLLALTQKKFVHLAALCFVAAIFTKQTALAPPLAVFAVLLLVRPRTAMDGIITGMLTASAMLSVLVWQTDGGFLRHILLYNINRIDPARLLDLLPVMGSHLLYFGVALVGTIYRIRGRLPDYSDCRGWNEIRRRLALCTGDCQFLMVLVYLAFTTVMLLTYAKTGSNYNYTIEWLCAVAILVGLALQWAAALAMGRGMAAAPAILTICLPLAVAIQGAFLPKTPLDEWHLAPRTTAELYSVSAIVRAASKPVISDEMVLLLRSGKTVQWEPSIFAELASKGVWDERPFVAKILHRDFAFFVTEDAGGEHIFESRYNPAVAAAMNSAYPVKRQLAGLTLHLPR